MSFDDDIRKFAKKIDERLEDVTKALLFQLNDYVIMQTPIDTGRARGSWTGSITSPVFTQGLDKSGRMTVAAANSVASRAMGKVYYLANGAPHIATLELGGYPKNPQRGTYLKRSRSYEILSTGGYSRQAPQGMARIGVKTAKQALEKLVRSYK